MADYTYHELMKMQNDAVRRAEEMQQRARKTAGLDEASKETAPFKPQEPRHIKMPEGYLSGKKESAKQENSTNNAENIFDKLKNSFGDINIDSDKALLLSLVMLFSEEKADELLIMALLYMLT